MRLGINLSAQPTGFCGLGESFFDPEVLFSIPGHGFWNQITSIEEAIAGTPFRLQNVDMEARSNGPGLCTSVEKDSVSSGDSAGTERSEATTLETVYVTVGSKSWLGMTFDLYIPQALPVPGGTSSIIVGQIKFTSGDAIQILLHQSGVLRLRRGTGGTNQIVAANGTRGVWHTIDIDGIWSKDSDGRLIVRRNGAVVVDLTSAGNIYPTNLGDAEKVYCKIGAYRASALSDEDRGRASIFFKNLSVRTSAPSWA